MIQFLTLCELSAATVERKRICSFLSKQDKVNTLYKLTIFSKAGVGPHASSADDPLRCEA